MFNHWTRVLLILLLTAQFLLPQEPATPTASESTTDHEVGMKYVRENYSKYEYTIALRDQAPVKPITLPARLGMLNDTPASTP